MVTASWMPRIIFGSLIRDTPPAARISAGMRSKAITAQAPAASAIRACSGVVTSIITPPLSICARLRFRVCLFSFIFILFFCVCDLFYSSVFMTELGWILSSEFLEELRELCLGVEPVLIGHLLNALFRTAQGKLDLLQQILVDNHLR